MKGEVISRTESICPVCLKKIAAVRVKYEDEVYMEKTCSEHGDFRTLIWKGLLNYETWENRKEDFRQRKEEGNCPYVCGKCEGHYQHVCCVLLEVTSRCSLHCPVCFADSEMTEGADMTLEDINRCFDEMMKMGGPFNIQLSGGEPTIRDDLDVIIRSGKARGFDFFQLNTNGLRLAREKGYASQLKEAGLDCVFLQFDGISDRIYERIRGKALLSLKKEAIQACREAGLGVILVPTLIEGINTDQVGAIIHYAIEEMPAVRGVHFQPVSYFGRFPENEQHRFTIPQLLRAIEEQTDGQMKKEDFTPGGAENAYCSFSGNFFAADGRIKPWGSQNVCGCGTKVAKTKDQSIKARKFVAKRWSAAQADKLMQYNTGQMGSGATLDTVSLDRFLEQVETRSLAVSCMTFMDSGNFDLERLKDCYIHVARVKEQVELIPFCAYNLTSVSGETLYRRK